MEPNILLGLVLTRFEIGNNHWVNLVSIQIELRRFTFKNFTSLIFYNLFFYSLDRFLMD